MPTNYWLKFGNTPLGYNGSGLQFTHVEQPGSLTISLLGTGTGFSSSKTFNVLVTFGSAIAYSVNGTPISTPSDNYTASLKNGQSVVLGNIPYGTTFVVTEQAISSADYNAGYSNGTVTGGSGTMTEAGTLTAVANYTYEANTAVIGGTRYKTTTIGGKVWMAENLDYKYSGLTVGGALSASGNRANYYNNSEATYGRSGNKYGLLYNRNAMLYLNTNRSTLIPGWHVPTWDELTALITAAGGSSVAGKRLKSTSGWSSGNGTNNYGFNAFPTGRVSGSTPSFQSVGSLTGVSCVTLETAALYRILILDTADSVATNSYTNSGSIYYPIRLVKD